MKTIFYLLFAFIASISKVFPLNNNKVAFIMTHEKDSSGSIGYIHNYLNQKNTFRCFFITKEDYRLLSFYNIWKGFFLNPFHLATSKYVFLDNVFLPMAFFKFKREVKVVQLWHGSGAIKKFGQDVNIGYLATLEKRANSKYTHIIANSKKMIEIYTSAFNVPRHKIFPVGLPRTDFFFNEHKKEEAICQLYHRYPAIREKKAILYAPTFRDDNYDNAKIIQFISSISQKIGDNYVLLLRLHPSIDKKIVKIDNLKRVINVSNYSNVNALMVASELLITDYSSIIFEYSLLGKPIIFFAYDYHHFKNLRDFYYDYEKFVPGPIVYDIEELLNLIYIWEFDTEKIMNFKRENFDYLDGKSTERVINLIFDSSDKNMEDNR